MSKTTATNSTGTKSQRTSGKLTKVKVSAKATPVAKSAGAKAKPQSAASKSSTKHNQILDVLRRKQGATIEELQKVSGWQAHSVRGFLSGTVKKKLGLKLQSIKPKEGERRYSISAK